MTKPTTKELLLCLGCRWEKKWPAFSDCPGDCAEKLAAIRALIEKYGDGGPIRVVLHLEGQEEDGSPNVYDGVTLVGTITDERGKG